MLFNSYEFLFLFLPIAFALYFILNRVRLTTASRVWLSLASLFFYSFWDIRYLPLLLLTIVVNFLLGDALSSTFNTLTGDAPRARRRLYLWVGLTWNLALLIFFKYFDFFIANLNAVTGGSLSPLNIILPLGISFFTFTQIAYLVDCYKGDVRESSLINYFLFVTFFPHLLAGPIIHHKEMMPQFNSRRAKILNYRNIAIGISLFSLGLFKKVLIADAFSPFANEGFDNSIALTFVEAWAASLSYTFQIYFDFSGYTDMALGISWLFNIRLPFNFNSPYKAVNIQDFWRRWHMTLSRFLRDYIYIPLGGNRSGEARTYLNLTAVFLIGGFWHGAGWTFLFWGLLHGIASAVHKLWQSTGLRMNRYLAIFLTFNFINITWVFFRAKDWESAVKVLKGMSGLNGVMLPHFLEGRLSFLSDYGISFGEWLSDIKGDSKTIPLIVVFFIFSVFLSNSNQIIERLKFDVRTACIVAVILSIGILSLSRVTEFIYFNF